MKYLNIIKKGAAAFILILVSVTCIEAQVLRVTPSLNNQTMVEPLNTVDGVFYGEGAGANNGTFGFQNSFLGYRAGQANSSGARNTYVGYRAGIDNVDGHYNVAIGHTSMLQATTGSRNTYLGYETGYFNSVGSGNVFIGHQAGKNSGGSNKLFLHNSAANSDQALIYGEFDNKYLRANSVFDVYSDRTDIASIRAVKNYAEGTLTDIPGVYGENTVDNFYGIGVDGKGGYIGTRGTVTGVEDDSYFGVSGFSTGGNAGRNYGIYGSASNSSFNNYGVYGTATAATGGKRYGVYGTASIVADSWAGYFFGDMVTTSKVGIGTSLMVPDSELHIKKTGDALLIIEADSDNSGEDDNPRIEFRQDGNLTSTFIGYDEALYGSNNFGISTDQATHAMIIGNSGNVGIGTNLVASSNMASGYRLSVNGKIAATEVRVQPTADWPDYVFASDYNLMSIKDVKKSIEKNNHLPGIPSAKEVKENGIELGEMQRKMMEKIEVLTLYIIDLQDQIDVLRTVGSQQSSVNSTKKSSVPAPTDGHSGRRSTQN